MTDRVWVLTVIVGALLTSATTGCDRHTDSDSGSSITLATTTSTRDSGLLDTLIPRFHQQTGITVKVVAVGSGQALELGRRGDADVLLTHAPEAEQEFMRQGHGLLREPVMHNDFVLVGPASDPAGIRGFRSIEKAYQKIADASTLYVSRGDRSGTHMKEQSLIAAARLHVNPRWFLAAGDGMAATLRMASEKGAYTLSDRSTYLSLRSKLQLEIMVQGDPRLINHYSVILVNPRRHAHLQAAGAEAFRDFLLQPATQQVIASFGVKQYGQPLFFPRARHEPQTTEDAARGGGS